MFYLIFRMFKIDLMIPEVIFSGLILAFISYELRLQHNLPIVDVIFQVIVFFAFLWLLFRIHIFYAAVLTGLCFQAYYLTQTFWYGLMDILDLFNGILDFPLQLSTYLLQTVSATTTFIIGAIIYAKRKGFDYVPDKPRGRLAIAGRDKILLLLTLLAMMLFFVTLSLSSLTNNIFYFVPVITAPFIYSYLLISYRKDRDY